MKKNIKVIITGSSGFLGKKLFDKFYRNKNYKVYKFNKSNGQDLRNYSKSNSYIKKINPDLIIHCAAYVGGIQFVKKNAVKVFEDNMQMSLNITKIVAKNKIKKFINIMPNCAYPSKYEKYFEDNWWDGKIHESVLVYGMSRKIIETACFAFQQKYSFQSLHLVLPNLYGPGDHFSPIRSHALGGIITKIVDAKINAIPKVEIWGSGKPIREWLYIDDAVEIILKIAKKNNFLKNNEIINIGTNQGISIKNLSEKIKKISKYRGKLIYNKKMIDGSKIKILSSVKIKKYYNWSPKTKLDNGLLKTIKYYLKIKDK